MGEADKDEKRENETVPIENSAEADKNEGGNRQKMPQTKGGDKKCLSRRRMVGKLNFDVYFINIFISVFNCSGEGKHPTRKSARQKPSRTSGEAKRGNGKRKGQTADSTM